MKKLVTAQCLILVLILSCCALAEAAALDSGLPDVENMSYELLLELKQSVDAEYFSRHEAEPIRFNPGTYVVGKDIKAGRYNYVVTCPPIDTSAALYVFDSYSAYQNSRYDYTVYYNLSLEEGVQSIDLIEGSCIQISNACIAFSVADFADEVFYQFVAPDGTYVPEGTYMVGVDLPVGTYAVYPASTERATLYLYSDYSSVYDGYDNYEYVYLLSQEDMKTLKPTIIEVKDGNLISIEYADVIMHKQQQVKNKLNFD